MKVWEALRLFASFYQTPIHIEPEQTLQRFDLTEYQNRSFENLSGGMKQRLLLALATLHHPKILFLDEPSAGLDPHSRRELWNLLRDLRNQGTTILLTTHDMREAEQLCDRIALLHQGQLVGLDRVVDPWTFHRHWLFGFHQCLVQFLVRSFFQMEIMGIKPLWERKE